MQGRKPIDRKRGTERPVLEPRDLGGGVNKRLQTDGQLIWGGRSWQQNSCVRQFEKTKGGAKSPNLLNHRTDPAKNTSGDPAGLPKQNRPGQLLRATPLGKLKKVKMQDKTAPRLPRWN